MCREGGRPASERKENRQERRLAPWEEARSMDEGPMVQGIVNWRVIVSFEPAEEPNRGWVEKEIAPVVMFELTKSRDTRSSRLSVVYRCIGQEKMQ